MLLISFAMKSRRKHNSQNLPSLNAKALRVIDYWRKSINDSSRIENINKSASSATIEIEPKDILGSNLGTDVFKALLAKISKEERGNNKRESKQRQSIQIALCPVRVREQTESRRKTTFPLLCIPATLHENGVLEPPQEGLPWIPRQHLEPGAGDGCPSISTVARTDKFFRNYALAEFRSFPEYWKYCMQFFKYSTGFSPKDFELEEYTRLPTIGLTAYSDNFGAYGSMLRALNQVHNKSRHPGLLFELCNPSKKQRSLYRRSRYSLYKNSQKHLGHFSASFSLAESQRQAVHRFVETPENQMFCVNGPPGTGKTTALQSFVASTWVEAALTQKALAPIQLVCGATNQSVLNVINSFAANTEDNSPIAARWIPGVNSYGSFCASFTKAESVSGYQLELPDGNGFSAKLETLDSVIAFEDYFLQQCSKHVEKVRTTQRAIKLLHSLLQSEVSSYRRELSKRLDCSILDIFTSPFQRLSPEQLREYYKRIAPLDCGYRHNAFLLATHYWEARWLEATHQELTNRESFGDTTVRFRPSPADWGRRAMLTPAFVSTLSMSCRFFACRENASAPSIDCLYFDEAGQVAPERAAAVSSLAKKAVVIGDTAQLKPYVSIPITVDQGTAEHYKLIKSNDFSSYVEFARHGLSAANSNLMELAVARCRKEDGRIIGAFLQEHRRSVPTIISYCNELSYQGRLKALRPEIENRIFPPFGFLESDSKAHSVGSSRRNRDEAKQIADFVELNSEKITERYGKPLDEVLAVLTPFTAQASEIRRLLTTKYPKMIIGTVHSLQGAEREIVLFSSVYDESPIKTYIFNVDPRILNVAVSRAKDSFIVFGNSAVFSASNSEVMSPTSLLSRYLFASPENILGQASKPVQDTNTDLNGITSKQRIATLEEHQEILEYALQIAKKRVLISSPTISCRAIEADNLERKIASTTKRGIEVLIFTDSLLDQRDGEIRPTALEGRQILRSAGAKVIVADRIHNKSLAIDNSILVEGSFNWLSAVRTAGSEHQKHETSVVIKGSDASKLISDLHEELYSRAQRF